MKKSDKKKQRLNKHRPVLNRRLVELLSNKPSLLGDKDKWLDQRITFWLKRRTWGIVHENDHQLVVE